MIRRCRQALICVLLALISSACSPLFEWHYQEIERFTSPDGMVDAVWVRGGGGATTGFVFELYLVPKGLKFEKDATSFKHPTFSGDHLEDFKVVWREPRQLELHFKYARILTFRNYWRYWNPDSPEVDRHYVVEAKLVPQVEGSTLPPGDRS